MKKASEILRLISERAALSQGNSLLLRSGLLSLLSVLRKDLSRSEENLLREVAHLKGMQDIAYGVVYDSQELRLMVCREPSSNPYDPLSRGSEVAFCVRWQIDGLEVLAGILSPKLAEKATAAFLATFMPASPRDILQMLAEEAEHEGEVTILLRGEWEDLQELLTLESL